LQNVGGKAEIHAVIVSWLDGTVTSVDRSSSSHAQLEIVLGFERYRYWGIGYIGQYLPVLGGIGIGPILFSVIMPNTGQTTVCGVRLERYQAEHLIPNTLASKDTNTQYRYRYWKWHHLLYG